MFGELAISVLALTRTTDVAARFLGVRPFLPKLFAQRYPATGMLDPDEFNAQLDECRSFSDAHWAAYWNIFAMRHLARLEGQAGARLATFIDSDDAEAPPELVKLLAAGARLLRDATLSTKIDKTWEVGAPDHREMMALLDAIRAMSYFFLAAWPGKTPRRQEAYLRSTRLLRVIISSVAEPLGFGVDWTVVKIQGETVRLLGLAPIGKERLPTILASNGLEGAISELALPMLRCRPQAAVYIIEMPGTYAYTKPIDTAGTTRIYSAVVDHLVSRPRVDPDRLGMLGLSFGAHWSTRMAIHEPRLKAVVSNGGPYKHTFGVTAGIGMPEIMIFILKTVTGATSLFGLVVALKRLSISNDDFARIRIPVLAINGEHDTLVSTQDTLDLAKYALRGERRMYDDDHCAIGHFADWVEYSMHWLHDVLSG